MGEVVEGRFPPELLDAWEWTDALRAEYADRARALAERYGSRGIPRQLPSWPGGRCQDCREVASRRFRQGQRLLCEQCARTRVRVARDIAEFEVNRSRSHRRSTKEHES
jgi:hypothetical protein